MGKPSAPAPPDYAAAAQQQGQANVNSAIASNYLNQVNQHGPNGNLDFSYDYTHGHVDPETGQTIPQVTATTTLSPDQQKLYDQNMGLSQALNDLASKGVGYVADATKTPLTPGQFSPLATSGPAITGNSMTTGVAGPDYSKLGAMPSANDFAAQRDQVTQALMDRLQPQLQQQQNRLDSNLANQGIALGSDAYKTAQNLNAQNVNDQRIAALLAGSQEQQRLFQDAMGIRQQGVDEANTQWQAGLANANLNNQAQQTIFNQGLASNQFHNQAVAQAIQQADYFKNQPLNMLNALRTGNQAQMPQFGNVAGGAQIAAAPIYAATNDAYQGALQAYNTQMQGYSGLLSGLGDIGSAGIAKWVK